MAAPSTATVLPAYRGRVPAQHVRHRIGDTVARLRFADRRQAVRAGAGFGDDHVPDASITASAWMLLGPAPF